MSIEAFRLRTSPGARPVVELLDQRRLPAAEVHLELTTGEAVAKAIRNMAVRGAPAIGIVAAMGLALDLAAADGDLGQVLEASRKRLLDTRPTAVNLAWALAAVADAVAPLIAAGAGAAQVGARALETAQALHEDDIARCRAIGEHGIDLVPHDAQVLTHCNAGALATGGYGTALGVIRSAAREGRVARVLASETRPFLQGARLTAWELSRDGIGVVLITDGMSGALMQQGGIDVVVVGADRIARNGDTANKIGTYMHAVLAHRHGIPFYVAAPLSTVDLETASGSDIPIEQRSSDEVVTLGGRAIGPAGVAGLHPAFDVTPAALISGIVTERGVARPPYDESLPRLLRG